MRYQNWRGTKSIETEFRKSLNYIVDLFIKICELSGDDQNEYIRRMDNFQNSNAYENFIYSAVRRMVTPLATKNFDTWRKAARVGTRSKSIYDLLMHEINTGLQNDIESQIIENAALIRTLPHDTALKVVRNIKDLTFKGERASTIAKFIRAETDKHARASARLIARTEVSKTQTALTKARSENLGLRWYVWRTAQDGNRVRPSHRIMEGVLINWQDPPSPEELEGLPSVGRYHAGSIWNCRCYPEPLIEIDDVSWPHKVYYQGKIQIMAKQKFSELM